MSENLFGDFESTTTTTNTNNEDPVAEFLAREKIELDKIENNDDFSAFSNANANSNDFGDAFGSNDLNSQTTTNLNDDFTLSSSNHQDNDGFNDDNLNTNNSTNNDNDAGGANVFYSAIAQADRLAQEPEKIKKWREEQRERLTKKDQEEELKKQEWRELAKKELDDWYKNRQEQLEKTHANNKINNKAAEAELVAQRNELSTGQEWDRISKLCDFNPKANKNTKDVSRMRSILLQLKQQPLIRHAN